MNLFDLYATISLDDSEYSDGLDRAGEKNKTFSNSFSSVSQGAVTLQNRIRVLSSQYDAAQKKVDDLTAKFNESAVKTGYASEETQELAQQLEEAENAAQDAKKKLDQYTDSTEDAGEESGKATGKLSSFASALKTGIAGAAKIAASAIGIASTAITALGKIAIDYNSEIEGYTTNFTVMLGDAEVAAQKVNELKEMGANTPFELSDLADATQTLLAFMATRSATSPCYPSVRPCARMPTWASGQSEAGAGF